jgi:NAD(P)H dehydrogenase (quinone)
MTIAVTGGNGEFGRAVLSFLAARSARPLVATVRDLAQVQPVIGVDYRPGGFDDPATLRASLAGVRTVLVNATFFGADPGLRLPRVAAAIQTAADAGVEHVVLTSWPDLERATMAQVQDYKQLETLVKSAGPTWTILRLGCGLADAVARDVVWAKAGGELVAPAAGARVTPAAVADLAEATAVVLSEAGPGHDRVVHELSGPDAVTWEDLAELAGVPFRAVDDEDYRKYLDRIKLPASTVEQLIALYADLRSDWASTPTPTLAKLIGRAPVAGLAAVDRRTSRFPIS